MQHFCGYFGFSENKPGLPIAVELSKDSVFTAKHSPEVIFIENSEGLIISTPAIRFKSQKSKAALEHLLDDLNGDKRARTATLAKTTGHYCLAYMDKASNTIYLATDKVGTQPLYFSATEKGFFFGNKLKDILAMAPDLKTISHQSIYQYIYFHCIPAPDTIYRDIKKLKAGELVSHQSSLATQTYFIPEFRNTGEDKEKLQNQLLTALENSVNRTIEDRELTTVGAFLSGGLDSSTVAGFFARKAGAHQAQTFTIGFDAEGYDESGFAQIAADHFKTDHRAYYVTPDDIQSALEAISAFYDEPFGNSSALPAYYCARFAKEHGITTLLAGDGGDELFAGNERYAKQKTFELFYKIPAPLRKLLLEYPFALIPENAQLGLLSKAASYIRQAKVPLPDRLQTYNFLHQFDPETVFTPELIGEVKRSYPLELLQARYSELSSGDFIQRMLYLDWKFTLADNDLVKVNNMCHLAGVDVVYPMLDDELLELATKVPSETLLPGNDLRKFYKDATTGFLSDKTINKSKKGFGLPFGVWLREHENLRNTAYDNVRELKTTGYFKDDFLEYAITMHGSDTPGYYGELIWILMMLNLWLKAH